MIPCDFFRHPCCYLLSSHLLHPSPPPPQSELPGSSHFPSEITCILLSPSSLLPTPLFWGGPLFTVLVSVVRLLQDVYSQLKSQSLRRERCILWCLSLWVWLTSLRTIFSHFIHQSAKFTISFPFQLSMCCISISSSLSEGYLFCFPASVDRAAVVRLSLNLWGRMLSRLGRCQGVVQLGHRKVYFQLSENPPHRSPSQLHKFAALSVE